MNYEKYDFVLVAPDLSEFKFQSVGPNGIIAMVIQFQEINYKIYNLAFGDFKEDGSIDDLRMLGNRDRDKILATVAAAVFEYTSGFPGRIVYFSGSTAARCRLYRMAIGVHHEYLGSVFNILGVRDTVKSFEIEPFRPNVSYSKFFVERKNL